MPNAADTEGNIVQVKLFTRHIDQVGINVLHYRVEVATTIGTTTNEMLANRLTGLFGPKYADVMPSTAQFYGVSVQQLTPFVGAAVHSTVTGYTGTIEGEGLPRQVSGIITKTTLLAGRRNRGRAYVAFPVEDDNDADMVPTASYLARALLIGTPMVYTGILTVNTTDAFSMRGIIWHKNDLPPSHTFIDGVAVQRKWATQRRRGSYGAANPAPW